MAPSDKLRGKGRCGVFAGKTVWSTPERLRGEVLTTRRYTNLSLPLRFTFINSTDALGFHLTSLFICSLGFPPKTSMETFGDCRWRLLHNSCLSWHSNNCHWWTMSTYLVMFFVLKTFFYFILLPTISISHIYCSFILTHPIFNTILAIRFANRSGRDLIVKADTGQSRFYSD